MTHLQTADQQLNLTLSILIRGCSHMTSSHSGGGGFQMRTIDDEGEGVLPMMMSSKIFKDLQDFFENFRFLLKIFIRILQNQNKNF